MVVERPLAFGRTEHVGALVVLRKETRIVGFDRRSTNQIGVHASSLSVGDAELFTEGPHLHRFEENDIVVAMVLKTKPAFVRARSAVRFEA